MENRAAHPRHELPEIRNTPHVGLNLNRVSVKLLKSPQPELVFSRRTGFSESKHLNIDKLMQLRSQVLSPTVGRPWLGLVRCLPESGRLQTNSLSLTPYGLVGERPGNEVETDDNNRSRCTKLYPVTTYSEWSTTILLDRFFEYAKIEQVKERLCWQGDTLVINMWSPNSYKEIKKTSTLLLQQALVTREIYVYFCFKLMS